MNDTVTVVRHGCFNDLGQSEHYGLSCADGIYFYKGNFLIPILQPDGVTRCFLRPKARIFV